MLISILGDVGSGKTLLSTYLAWTDSRPVYANYELRFPRYRYLKPETLLKLQSESLVIVDEAYTWLESRLSGRSINLYFSYILFQSRKRGLDIIITDQLVGTVDLRFRQMTNYEIQCEATEEGFEYRIFKLSNYYRFKPRRFVMPYSVAEQIYPLYDSWERIDPIDSELIYKISKDKTEIVKEIDGHVAKLLKIAPVKDITKGIVSDYCLRNDLVKSYVDLIYNGVKASRFKS